MPKGKIAKVKFPCGQCHHECKSDCVYCVQCTSWFHSVCENIKRPELSILSDNAGDYICSSCCTYHDGSFDFDASLKRLFQATGKSEAHLRSVAKTEAVIGRNVTVPITDDGNFDCVLPTDDTADDILHRVGGSSNKRPVCVPGDGNCLFSAVSVALTGHTELANVLRQQTAIELAINGTYYKRKHSEKSFSIVSPSYKVACRDAAKNYNYSSAWTIQALSTVIGRDIVSIYPTVNGVADKTVPILHTTIEPRNKLSRQQLHIMWSSTMSPPPVGIWTPNHFVPLIERKSTPIEVTLSPQRSPEEWPDLPKNLSQNTRSSPLRFDN